MPKTALHQAASAGNVPAVAQLLRSRSSQVTCWDKDGWTPLHHACRNSHVEVAAFLIKEGADVNAKNKVRVVHYSGAVVPLARSQVSSYCRLWNRSRSLIAHVQRFTAQGIALT